MSVPRKLAAILAADVAGYSRLMGDDEAGIAPALHEHRAAIDPIVATHGVRIVKTTGDVVPAGGHPGPNSRRPCSCPRPRQASRPAIDSNGDRTQDTRRSEEGWYRHSKARRQAPRRRGHRPTHQW